MARELKADIVIIGSGGGMAAAVAAAEAGVRHIIVLEKQGIPGGNTRLAYGFFACGSPVQEKAGIVTDHDDYFRKAMKWAHWSGVNPRLVRAFIEKSGDTIRWLEARGVPFAPIKPDTKHPTGHNPVGGGRKLMDVLVERSRELGVKTMLHTSAREIVMGSRGAVRGVVAASRGSEFTIGTKAVIIATGSIRGNKEMLRKYCPDFIEDMHLGRWPYHTGDGLILAAGAGAAIARIIPIFHVGPIPESGPWGSMVAAVRYPYTVWVNKRGERFIDEAGYGVWENGNAILRQPGRVMYNLFDAGIRRKMEEDKLFAEEGWAASQGTEEERAARAKVKFQEQLDKGALRQFATLEEVARWIKVKPDVLKATVEEYNAACAQGRDPVFAKDKAHLMPLATPPYYGVRCLVDCGETMGGIRVNEHLEALNDRDNVIPGLYAAGVVADGWSGQCYPSDDLGGSAFGFSVNSGRMAGESAARFVLGEGK